MYWRDQAGVAARQHGHQGQCCEQACLREYHTIALYHYVCAASEMWVLCRNGQCYFDATIIRIKSVLISHTLVFYQFLTCIVLSIQGNLIVIVSSLLNKFKSYRKSSVQKGDLINIVKRAPISASIIKFNFVSSYRSWFTICLVLKGYVTNLISHHSICMYCITIKALFCLICYPVFKIPFCFSLAFWIVGVFSSILHL